MFKKILLFVIMLFTISACTLSGDGGGSIVLDDIYYNKGDYINIDSRYFEEKNPTSYVLFVYNSFCTLKIPCDTIFQKYMDKYNIDFLSINIDEYKKTELYNTVKYAPTIIIVEKGEIAAYLDAESDDDLDKYQDAKVFESWINKYISTKK